MLSVCQSWLSWSSAKSVFWLTLMKQKYIQPFFFTSLSNFMRFYFHVFTYFIKCINYLHIPAKSLGYYSLCCAGQGCVIETKEAASCCVTEVFLSACSTAWCKCTSTEVCSLASPLFPLQALSGELSPFLCSGSHQAQRDCQPSALNCFVEAMSQCVPPIPIRPCVLKYLGKTHNLWLRSTLMLEQQAFEKGLSLHSKPKQSTEFYEQESITPPQQVLRF